MNVELIRQTLGRVARMELARVEYVPQIDSTNAEAMRRLHNGDRESGLLVAGQQTSGRGRRGRSWLSPAGQGIYMTLVKEVSGPADSLQSLSLVTALSVHAALQGVGANGLKLKWPNDIYHNNRKLAGILLELFRDTERHYLVFGICLNICLQEETLSGIGQPATDLLNVLSDLPANERVVAAICNQLLLNLNRFDEKGFGQFRQQWNQHDQFLGEQVELVDGNRTICGSVLGVDEFGALRLESSTGIVHVNSGELLPSLRPASTGHGA
ncbi:MAG: biotin--[acetyl-CoA-carboxylase] ligase [Gammaproteobacteria bacterium]